MIAVVIESSLTGIFKLLLIILVAYIVYSLLVRFIFPQIIRNALRNFQQGNSKQQYEHNTSDPKHEGEVTIQESNDLSDNKNPGVKHDAGEYIDFEEIQESK